jgi:Zn-dependent protease
MAEYYKIDGRKITLREYWNIARSWRALLAWIAARLGAPLQFGTAFRQPDSVRELQVADSEFSPQAKAKLHSLLEQCLQLGFHSPRYYSFETIRRDTRTSFIAMLHHSGEFTLRLMHSLATNATPPVENVLAVLLSELNDGTFFFTSDQPASFKSTPGILNNRLIGGTPPQLIQSHQRKLVELGARNPPRPVRSAESMDEVWDRYEKVSLDFQVSRGIYVRMTPEEAEGQHKLLEAAQTMTADGVQHAEVLVELNQLQNKKGGWGNAILIFLVSMIVFVTAGSQQWSWKYALMLVPILFVHELGHYAAMRAFDYRNLRMFFLPFFGAAVAGRHYNVPGWKKVVVSIMGPAPGIVLGAVIGGIGLVLHQSGLIQIALVMLILNGINLLPVLPLDGGWIFHALFFSRHPLLDAAFRVLAVIALAVGGMYSRDKILMYIGIPMALGIPTAYRIARITADLRKRGVAPGSPDNQTIPTETAQTIISELKRTLSKGHTNKMLAQQTLQIFETLNARPPGWLATSGLLCAYVTCLGMAAVFAGVCIVGQRGDLRSLLATAAHQPKRTLVCGTIASWRGDPAEATDGVAQINIIATFPTRGDVMKAFQALTNQLPSFASLTTFGESLLLTLPEADDDVRKQWFGELQRQAKEVFVDSINYPARLTVSCNAINQQLAGELESELNEYFHNDSTQSLIPPWIPDDRRSPEQHAAHQLARKTYLRAQRGRWDGYADPKMQELQKQIGEAQRQGDKSEVTRLTRQMTELVEDLERQRLNKLKSGTDGPVDVEVIDLFAALPAMNTKTNRDGMMRTLQEIARRMGQLPLENNRVTPGADRFATHGGWASSKGRLVHLSLLSFRRIRDGAPALIDWLCAKGCTDLKYEMHSGTAPDPDEAE